MKTQFDHSKRIVSLENLKAMCARESGTCHRFEIECESSPHRVKVAYSNPDEYGNECPLVASFPCYPSGDDKDNPCVVLDILRVTGGRDSYDREEGWQAFQPLLDAEPLHRMGCLPSDPWMTRYEIIVSRKPELAVSSSWDKAGCLQTWHCKGKAFPSYREAQTYACALSDTIDNLEKTGVCNPS